MKNSLIYITSLVFPISDNKIYYIGKKYIQELHLQYRKSQFIIFNVHFKAGFLKKNIQYKRDTVVFLKDRIKKLKDNNENINIASYLNLNIEKDNHIIYTKENSNYKYLFEVKMEKSLIKDDSYFTYCNKENKTYFYKDYTGCLDYFLLNKNFLNEKDLYLKNTGVYKDKFLFYKDKVSYKFSTKNNLGYSDHLPIFLELGYK